MFLNPKIFKKIETARSKFPPEPLRRVQEQRPGEAGPDQLDEHDGQLHQRDQRPRRRRRRLQRIRAQQNRQRQREELSQGHSLAAAEVGGQNSLKQPLVAPGRDSQEKKCFENCFEKCFEIFYTKKREKLE